MSDFMSNFLSDPVMRSFFNIVGPFWNMTWPFWLSLVLLPILNSAIVAWRQELFRRSIKWSLLEIMVPREVRKSPKAMEQVLQSISGLRNSANDFMEYYVEGEYPLNFSLEMTSFGGEIHLYIRTPTKLKAIVEAAFLSYYPDVEMVEVEDYALTKLPGNIDELQATNYDLWGTDLILDREDAYPIKTYKDFEAPDEEKTFDPIAALLEVLSAIDRRQMVVMQILIVPAGPKWKDRWSGLVNKLYKSEHSGTIDDDDENRPVRMTSRSPGETDILEAVENNLSKQAFETVIRFLYITPKELFNIKYPLRGVLGVFNQYSALNLNSFRRNYHTSTLASILSKPYVFPDKRLKYRKERILYNYRERKMPESTFMGKLMFSYLLNWNFGTKTFSINTECLATIFHPPIFLVLTAPHLHRVESRKSGPPSGLAIFGEESEIEKFQ